MFAYSIYDSKADSYSPPFFVPTDAEAVRGVILGIRNGKSTFALFPAEHRLCCVGSFNPASGSLVALPKIRTVSELVALAEVPSNG